MGALGDYRAMTIEWRALVIACVVVTACGGRSTLDTGDWGADAPGPGSSNPGSSDPGGPDRSGSDPGGTDPNHPDPADPTPGTLDPSNPDPSTPDPGTPAPDPTPAPDVNCSSDHAKGGMACTMPCVTTCGYYDMGTKACDCVNGVFVSCHCPRPWNYQGRTTAPACNTADGRTHWIDNTPCTEEWAQCIGTDPVAGTNPRGCVCLTDPVNGKLEWTCGSTNKWFLAE
jgi:hypothetical protein